MSTPSVTVEVRTVNGLWRVELEALDADLTESPEQTALRLLAAAVSDIREALS